MTSPNLGYLFYKDYYRGLDSSDWEELVTKKEPELSSTAKKHIAEINKKLNDSKISHYSGLLDSSCISMTAPHTFELKTIYPGLLTGSGWDHSAGNIEDEFKMGFYFDYTTGLPVMPGPSVKGKIRSAFSNREYIAECLESLGCRNTNADKLEKEIFEGISNDKPMPKTGRDIFHDAVIVRTEGEDDSILGDDFITPHKDNPYDNPTPIKFLKVLPSVIFRFQFALTDGLISSDNKLKLFQRIILDLGLGAKTAVGYGQFEKVSTSFSAEAKKIQIEEEQRRKETEKQQRLQNMSPVDRILEEFNQDINTIINRLKKGELQLEKGVKKELAGMIKAIMIERKIWNSPKQPKKKKRVQFIKLLLEEE